VGGLIEEAKEWLAGNQDATPKVFDKKYDELNDMFKPLAQKTVDIINAMDGDTNDYM